MTTPHAFAPETLDAVTRLRQMRVSWVEIAREVGCSRQTLNRHYRPHLSPELQAPRGHVWRGGETLKQSVFAYLDEHGDTPGQIIAETLNENYTSVHYHVRMWRKAQERKAVPNVERRCDCWLPLEDGEDQCALCVLQSRGMLIVYGELAREVGEYLDRGNGV